MGEGITWRRCNAAKPWFESTVGPPGEDSSAVERWGTTPETLVRSQLLAPFHGIFPRRRSPDTQPAAAEADDHGQAVAPMPEAGGFLLAREAIYLPLSLNSPRLCISPRARRCLRHLIPGSSAVERTVVSRQVDGSNPYPGSHFTRGRAEISRAPSSFRPAGGNI